MSDELHLSRHAGAGGSAGSPPEQQSQQVGRVDSGGVTKARPKHKRPKRSKALRNARFMNPGELSLEMTKGSDGTNTVKVAGAPNDGSSYYSMDPFGAGTFAVRGAPAMAQSILQQMTNKYGDRGTSVQLIGSIVGSTNPNAGIEALFPSRLGDHEVTVGPPIGALEGGQQVEEPAAEEPVASGQAQAASQEAPASSSSTHFASDLQIRARAFQSQVHAQGDPIGNSLFNDLQAFETAEDSVDYRGDDADMED